MAETLAMLRAAFPRQEFPPISVQIYVRALADLDASVIHSAACVLIGRSKWMPSIAEIRREAAEQLLNLPTATEAWLMVNSPIGRAGAPPPVKRAIEVIGGEWTIKSQAADSVERRFRAAYTEIREAELAQIAERRPPGLMVGNQPHGELRVASE